MSKKVSILCLLLLSVVINLANASQVRAEGNCVDLGINITSSTFKQSYSVMTTDSASITINGPTNIITPGKTYYVEVGGNGDYVEATNPGSLTANFEISNNYISPGNVEVGIEDINGSFSCTLLTFTIVEPLCAFSMYYSKPGEADPCALKPDSCKDTEMNIGFSIACEDGLNQPLINQEYKIVMTQTGPGGDIDISGITDGNGKHDTGASRFGAGNHTAKLMLTFSPPFSAGYLEFTLQPAVCEPSSVVCQEGDPIIIPPPDPLPPLGEYDLCAQISDSTAKTQCINCLGEEGSGIWTAIGCVPTAPEGFIKVFVKLGLNIAGGVAIIMMLVSGFMLSTAQGDPKKATDARDMMSAAVIGLLFIIFSITILQFIGVTIIKIPGFAEGV